jgi:hypothetical protein
MLDYSKKEPLKMLILQKALSVLCAFKLRLLLDDCVQSSAVCTSNVFVTSNLYLTCAQRLLT